MNPWLFLVLLPAMALTTYRLTRLAVKDDFPPALWLRDRLVGGWRDMTEAEVDATAGVFPDQGKSSIVGFGYVDTDGDGNRIRYVRRAKWVPHWLADLLSCPFCASGWIGGAVVAATWFAPAGASIPVLCWFSAWALGGIVAAQDWA